MITRIKASSLPVLNAFRGGKCLIILEDIIYLRCITFIVSKVFSKIDFRYLKNCYSSEDTNLI
jgi:hypothetical protein